MVCTAPSDIMSGIAQIENLMLYTELPFSILLKIHSPPEGERRDPDQIIRKRSELARGCAKDGIRLINDYIEYEAEPGKTYMNNIKSRLERVLEFSYNNLDLLFGLDQVEKLKPIMDEHITKLNKMYNDL